MSDEVTVVKADVPSPPDALVASPKSEAPWTNYETKLAYAAKLVSTGFCPAAVRTPPQALAILETARELGLPPVHALLAGRINVINGKVTLAAELMMAKMLQAGIKLEWVASTPKVATLRASRPESSFTGSFTLEEAAAAGLLTKDGWKKYPAAMLRARVIALVARVVAPDVISGMYTPEEVGADVDDTGTITRVLPAPPPDGQVVDSPPLPAPFPAGRSPFEAASWRDAFSDATTPGDVRDTWRSLMESWAGTFKGWTPDEQLAVATAWDSAKRRTEGVDAG